MAKYKCKMCGAPLNVSEGQTVISCDYCQSKQTVPNANDERKENLFNRANSLRLACDFDKAILSYQSILAIFPDEPEASGSGRKALHQRNISSCRLSAG